jgi:hypothetical protein
MAIESVSALSPIMAYGQRTQASRPVETAAESQPAENARASTPSSSPRAELAGPEASSNWNWAVAQPGVSASPSETEGSIRSASTQIAQAYGSGQTSAADIRSASEAYRNQASARDQAAQQQQGEGTRTLDIFA